MLQGTFRNRGLLNVARAAVVGLGVLTILLFGTTGISAASTRSSLTRHHDEKRHASAGASQDGPATTIAVYAIKFLNDREVKVDRAGQSTLENPGSEWLRTSATTRTWPVAYNTGTTMALKAAFFVTGPVPAGMVTITGTTTVEGTQLTLQKAGVTLKDGENIVLGFAPPAGKTATLPNEVTQMLLPGSPMTITWVVTTAGNATFPAGTSSLDLFVLLGGAGPVFLTVVWHTTHGAMGQSTTAGVVNGTWSEFSDGGNAPVASFVQKTLNAASGIIGNGHQLDYYDPGNIGFRTCKVTNASDLLRSATGIGQCGSWAHLFKLSLETEGISSTIEYDRFPVAADGKRVYFLVQNWKLAGCMGATGNAAFPFRLNQLTIRTAAGGGCDQPGVAGQGDANPTSWFGLHIVVNYNTALYDPSYGILQNSKPTFAGNLVAYNAKMVAARCIGDFPTEPTAPNVFPAFTASCAAGS
jgi:hypothetical protein